MKDKLACLLISTAWTDCDIIAQIFGVLWCRIGYSAGTDLSCPRQLIEQPHGHDKSVPAEVVRRTR